MFEWLWCLSNLIIKPRMLSYEKGFQREINCKHFDINSYKAKTKKSFTIRSDYGYVLSCELIESDIEKDKTKQVTGHEAFPANQFLDKKIAILCHGLGYAKYGSIKYMEMFLRLGFAVIIYDHRNHGLSGKAHTSMGYYEKYDLKKVVDWCYKEYGEKCSIITHGESMGAATVLLHLGIDNRVKCAIADCAYSDLKQLLIHQLKRFYHLPCFVLPVESLITYIRAGFWYKDVSPINIVAKISTPVMFIHGKIDNFVPTSMSKEMYACKKENKAIYLVANALHAQSYCTNPKGYENRVEAFLKRYL